MREKVNLAHGLTKKMYLTQHFITILFKQHVHYIDRTVAAYKLTSYDFNAKGFTKLFEVLSLMFCMV